MSEAFVKAIEEEKKANPKTGNDGDKGQEEVEAKVKVANFERGTLGKSVAFDGETTQPHKLIYARLVNPFLTLKTFFLALRASFLSL